MAPGGSGYKWMKHIVESNKIRDEYYALPWYKKLITRNPTKDYVCTFINLGTIKIRLED